ncbi:polysaccharide export protein [Psychromonas sp. RZ5]|nr:polysaccharide export protein [Psychromonas sp. RZ5]
MLCLIFIAQPVFAAFEPSSIDSTQDNNSGFGIPEIGMAPSLATNTLSSETYQQKGRSDLLLPGEVDINRLLPSSREVLPPPYGANLFAGGYESERSDGLSNNYLIAAGDKINIWMWGGVNYSDLVTVDNQGNIFIPKIGPIKVQGVKASNINTFVTNKIKATYTNNVNVYVNLLSATPVSVYISGPVIRPGQYAGMASDSLLYFLKRAGGIDSERGSYRDIQVLRNNQVVMAIDLYKFVQTGQLPNINFKDKDIILVKPQKSAINVSGAVRNPFRFELINKISTGKELASYAKPLAKISHIGVYGHRETGPFSVYLEAADFESFSLQDGDSVVFNADQHTQIIDVQISGSYMGPSYFTVKNTTRLHDLLSHIPINPALTDQKSIYILRESVAQRQKQLLNDSLDRLERSVFTTPVSSDGDASLRAKEAEMVMQFTEKARKVQPLGKVIVSDNGHSANILLEKGDKIVIPHYTDLVQVAGEVTVPQAIVFNSEAKVDDYIAWAGGFTERAEDQRISIVRANGTVIFDTDTQIQRGDQIIVMPKVEAKTLQTVKDITQILYQIAVAANVALSI